jgi:hypothetical protein
VSDGVRGGEADGNPQRVPSDAQDDRLDEELQQHIDLSRADREMQSDLPHALTETTMPAG